MARLLLCVTKVIVKQDIGQISHLLVEFFIGFRHDNKKGNSSTHEMSQRGFSHTSWNSLLKQQDLTMPVLIKEDLAERDVLLL
jgi:hypothetical protein